MQAEKISTWEKIEICIYKFISTFPVFVTFGLYSYLFTFFIVFFIYPTLAGNYDTLIGIPNFWSNDEERQQETIKATVLLGVFSFLAFMLALSIIQTIRTPPGSIPEDKEWDMQTDSMAESSSDEDSIQVERRKDAK